MKNNFFVQSWVYLTKNQFPWKAKFLNSVDELEKKRSQELVYSHDFVRIKFPHFDSELNADYCYESLEKGQETYSR